MDVATGGGSLLFFFPPQTELWHDFIRETSDGQGLMPRKNQLVPRSTDRNAQLHLTGNLKKRLARVTE